MRAPLPHLPRVLRPTLARAVPLLLACGTLLLACTSGVPLTIETPPINARTRALYARTNLEKARALRAAGRLDVAESVTRRGLSFEPDDPDLLRLRADLLEKLGRPEEAVALREHADRIDPPPPPLDDAPHPLASPETEVVVALLPPSSSLLESAAARGRLPASWPEGEAAETLRERFQVRLPDARIEIVADDEHPVARSVPDAQAWVRSLRADAVVSVRVDRAFCAQSVKDGDFAVAWLRVAVALPNAAEPDTHLVRTALDTPVRPGCEAAAIARAVERVLELHAVQQALTAGPASTHSRFANASIRATFPVLERRLEEEVVQGRRYLSLGELDLAQDRFQAAAAIDPEDPATLAFLDDVGRTLELARQLERKPRGSEAPAPGDEPERGAAESADPAAAADDEGGAVHLAAQLSPAQRLGLEAQLAHERRRREEMLSALAVLYEMRNAPTGGTVAAMHPTPGDDPKTTGAVLARARVPQGRAVEVRTLYAPNGSVIARYYFPDDSDAPVLREDDTSGDGTPDRWLAYENGVVSEVWEAENPGSPPNLHLVYGPGGSPIERVEIDHDGDGRLDRLFVYSGGRLREESWDTNGDGAFDRFQQFDESGSLTLREEDVDGDERIDVRTAYNKGRIVRREILNEEILNQELRSRVQ